jgi:hypothetical protein
MGNAGDFSVTPGNWITNTVSTSFFNPYAVIFNGVYVLVDLGVNTEHSLYISSNGVDWAVNKLTDMASSELFLGVPIIAGNTLYALACQRSAPPDYAAITSNTIWLVSSANGKQWTTQVTNMQPIIDSHDSSIMNNLDLSFADGKFSIVQVNEDGHDVLLTSSDGIIWQTVVILPTISESGFPTRAIYW